MPAELSSSELPEGLCNYWVVVGIQGLRLGLGLGSELGSELGLGIGLGLVLEEVFVFDSKSEN